MKKRIVSSLLLSLVLVAAFALSAYARQTPPDKVGLLAQEYFAEFPSDSNVIKVDKLFSLMKEGEDMFFLDIRRPEDYKKSHLKGAVNLSFFDMSIPEGLEKLPDDKPIMVYCYTGQTGSQVTVLLNIAGKTAKNVQFGFTTGIAKTEGNEALLEQTDTGLPQAASAVDSDVKTAISAYFVEKNSKDGTPFANFNVAPKTIKAIVDEQNDDYLILSVRRADDFAKGHVPSAVNVPFGQGMEKELIKLPRDRKIVVYCYTGQTSSQTMAVLRLMGYEAYSMAGGMTAWTKDNFAVEAK